MSNDVFAGMMGALIGGLSCLLLHLWRLTIAEERFEQRFDDAANYWYETNRKLSVENESLRAGYRSLFPKLYECCKPDSSEIDEIRKAIETAAAMRAAVTTESNGDE